MQERDGWTNKLSHFAGGKNGFSIYDDHLDFPWGGRSLAVILSALYRNSCIKGRLAKGHPSALCHYYVCKLAARFSTPERRYNIARRFFLLRPLLLPPPRPKFLRYRSRSFRSHFHFERIIPNPCCYRLSCYRVSLTRKW